MERLLLTGLRPHPWYHIAVGILRFIVKACMTMATQVTQLINPEIANDWARAMTARMERSHEPSGIRMRLFLLSGSHSFAYTLSD